MQIVSLGDTLHENVKAFFSRLIKEYMNLKSVQSVQRLKVSQYCELPP